MTLLIKVYTVAVNIAIAGNEVLLSPIIVIRAELLAIASDI